MSLGLFLTMVGIVTLLGALVASRSHSQHVQRPRPAYRGRTTGSRHGGSGWLDDTCDGSCGGGDSGGSCGDD